jgi:hypothetical protein
MPSPAPAPLADIRVRKAERADLDELIELEHRVFDTERRSRRRKTGCVSKIQYQ